MNYRLAVIGNEASVLLYRAVGAEVFAVFSPSQAVEKLQELVAADQGDEAKTPLYAVIFVEESFYKDFSDDLLKRLTNRPLPAVIPVPSSSSEGESFSSQRMSKIVERAVGSDILGDS